MRFIKLLIKLVIGLRVRFLFTRLKWILLLIRIIIDRGYLRGPDIIIAYSSEDKNFENSGKLGSRFLYPVHNEVSDAGYKVQTILWDENPLSKDQK